MKENKNRDKAGADTAARLRTLIGRQPFFKGLPPGQLEVLAELAVEKDFPAGTRIFQEGDPANRFYLILEGRVELHYENAEQDDIAPEVLKAGDNLGWSWLFPPYYFTAGAVSLEPTRTIFFYGTRLRQKCEDDHDLGYEIMKRAAQVAIHHLAAARRAATRPRSASPPAGVPLPRRK